MPKVLEATCEAHFGGGLRPPTGKAEKVVLGPGWESEGLVVLVKPGNSGGGKGPWFWCALDGGGDRELSKRLEPEQVERLRKKLYEEAKRMRHKLRSQGAARFSAWEAYGSAGVLDIC